jgi:hypothetical protein
MTLGIDTKRESEGGASAAAAKKTGNMLPVTTLLNPARWG